MNTTMREAFMAAKVKGDWRRCHIVASIIGHLNTKAGVKRDDKGWSTNLSFRTYSKLKADGILN